MADPFQSLFSQYVQQTPDGRYFLPFSKTAAMQFPMTVPGSDNPDDPTSNNMADGSPLSWHTNDPGQRPYYLEPDNPGLGPDRLESDRRKFYSARDYYDAMPVDYATLRSGGGQNYVGFNNATKGDYNGDFGYYVDPASSYGTNPAHVGQKPNESGLWNALSILAPAAGGIFAGAGEGGSVGSSAFEGSVPTGTGGSIAGESALSGSTGDSSLTGGAGVDTGANMGEGAIDDFSTGGTDQGIFSSPSQTSDPGFLDLVGKYGSQLGGALYKLFTGSGSGGVNGAALGGLLGSLGGGAKPAGTTTTIQDIPDWQKALLMPALSQSYGLLQQQQGQSYPLLNSAQDTLGKTISGDFLNSNPYLDATYNQAAKSVTDNYNSVVRPQNDAMFYKAGAFGPSNSAYDETVARNQFGLGQNLQNLATNIYGGNFTQERQNQLNASINAPAFSQAASATQWSPFQNFLSVAGGNFGGSQQSPYFQNKTGNIFGGALLGSQLFK